ncbi:MAG: PEGA domain-containing protein [Fibrobacter sp.]|nr:PEGA domain-containing protein [Fibrobacter sp.]
MNHFVTAFLFFALMVPSAFAKYVAVLETITENAELLDGSELRYLTDVFRGEAVKALPAEQNYTIMTRENISMMLPPGTSIEDCEGSCLAETGKKIAADYVTQARIGKVGEGMFVTAELYETGSNKLVASFNGKGNSLEDLEQVVIQKSGDFFKKIKVNSGYTGFGGIGDVSSGGSFSFQGQKKFIVEIVTQPEGALPTIDGKGFPKCTSTPCKVQVEAGEHRFVASLDHYEDAEKIEVVSSNDQKIELELLPNFGYLNLRPVLVNGIGRESELKMTIDNVDAKIGNNMLDPGLHEVSIRHRCYDPVDFKVLIEKQKTETFNQKLNVGVAGLELDVEWAGDPQVVPVYVNGKDAGSTPFVGEVPVCGSVSVGDRDQMEDVPLDLKWHEVTKMNYSLQDAPDAVISRKPGIQEHAQEAYVALDCPTEDDCKQTQPDVGESIPANVNQEKSGYNIGLIAASSVITVTGIVLGVVGNSNAKSAHEKGFTSEKEYRKNKDDAHNGQLLRTIGTVTAIVGGIGLGLSFTF